MLRNYFIGTYDLGSAADRRATRMAKLKKLLNQEELNKLQGLDSSMKNASVLAPLVAGIGLGVAGGLVGGSKGAGTGAMLGMALPLIYGGSRYNAGKRNTSYTKSTLDDLKKKIKDMNTGVLNARPYDYGELQSLIDAQVNA